MTLVSGAAPKVALVHYWLVNMRGGERVLEALCRLYPQADIFTHVLDRQRLSPLLQSRNIATTFIQRLPAGRRLYQKYLPLMPLALEQLDLGGYDLIISSESGPAKGVLTRAESTHICYCHTPMRYLWDFYPQYLAAASAPVRLAMRPLFHRLRQWDVLSAARVDHFVANSRTVARRIRKHWRRDAAVVHPPVDTGAFPLREGTRGDYYLYLGQLVDYKRVDLAVAACTRLGRPLVVVGEGEARKRLEAQAGPSVRFVGRRDGAEIARLYAGCRALLFPGEEDFGIVPVEAMATGAPVIAYGRGGATETVVDGVTGLFFHEQQVDALTAAMEAFERRESGFDPAAIRTHALAFSEERFRREFLEQVARATAVAKGVDAQQAAAENRHFQDQLS